MRLGLFGCALVVFGCGSEGAFTTTNVEFEIEPCTAARTARLEVRVYDEGGELRETFTEEAPTFPTGVQLREEGEAGALWTVEAEVFDESSISLSTVRAAGAIGDDALTRVFYDDCLGVVCTAGHTCEAGACVASRAPQTSPAGPGPSMCPEWFFVAPGGATSPCGGADTPCDAPETALGLVDAAGAIINIQGDATYESFEVPRDLPGPVLLRAWPGTGTPTFEVTNETQQNVIDVYSPNVALQGLRVVGGNEHGISVNFRAGMLRNIHIRGCIVESNGQNPGMFPDSGGLTLNNGVEDFIIEDSIFRNNVGGSPTHGAYINKVTRGVVRRNRFENNETNGVAVQIASDVLLEDNRIVNNGARGVIVASGEIRLRHNRICSNAQDGVRVTESPETSTPSTVDFEQNSVVGQENGILVVGVAANTINLDSNIIAFNDVGVGLQEGVVSDLVNLFFGNEEDVQGFTRSDAEDDLSVDPAFVSRSDCVLERSADTPAGFGAR